MSDEKIPRLVHRAEGRRDRLKPKGRELPVNYFGIERQDSAKGAGAAIQGFLERAAMGRPARRGLKTAEVGVEMVSNDAWRAHLESLGYTVIRDPRNFSMDADAGRFSLNGRLADSPARVRCALAGVACPIHTRGNGTGALTVKMTDYWRVAPLEANAPYKVVCCAE